LAETRIVWRGDSHYGRAEAWNGLTTMATTIFSAFPAMRRSMRWLGDRR
jgi:hypothetical protein